MHEAVSRMTAQDNIQKALTLTENRIKSLGGEMMNETNQKINQYIEEEIERTKSQKETLNWLSNRMSEITQEMENIRKFTRGLQ